VTTPSLFAMHGALAALDDDAFHARALEAAHLACALMTHGGYDDAETIGDTGLIHGLLHLAMDPTADVSVTKMRFDALAIGWVDTKCAPPISSDGVP
jgi:hypothetical protein